MGFIKYNTEAAYTAAGKPTDASRVALVTETNDAKIDGVNVITKQPTVGDVIFLDGNNNIVYLKGGDQLVKSLIPSDWTHVGYVFRRFGSKVAIINKDGSDEKYADVLQFTISAITDTAIAITVRNKNGTSKTVNVTLTAAEISQTSADEINAAVQAAEIDDQDWWAYLNDAGDAIIVQCDTWSDYRQASCSMTGGTIAFTTWGDMPASDRYFKNDGGYTQYRGVMNVARTRSWASSNGRVPTEMEPIKVTGNVRPVQPACFEDSTNEAYQYTALIRAEYGTYDNYLRNGYGVAYPQKYGTFALPSDAELSVAYATLTAPTKGGSTKAKFPAMNACATVAYNNTALAAGKMYLPGSLLGCYLMDDDTLAALAPSISKMGTTAINNSTNRWLAERYSVFSARNFGSQDGHLGFINVYFKILVQAVTLLDL